MVIKSVTRSMQKQEARIAEQLAKRGQNDITSKCVFIMQAKSGTKPRYA